VHREHPVQHLALPEGRRPARRGAKAESPRPPVADSRRPVVASLGWAHPSDPGAQTLERPFQVVQAAEVAHLAQPADLEQQPVAARLAVQVEQVAPRLVVPAAAHGGAVPQPGAPDAEEVAAAVAAQHEAAAVGAAARDAGVVGAAVPPDEEVEVEVVVPPQAAQGAAAERQRAAERPSGAAPSAAALAFRRDRFQPAARPARRPLAHSRSVRARAGLRVAQR
jgi:hypothetical protein